MMWSPSAQALGAIRICVTGVFLLSIVFTSFEAIGSLPTTLMRPPGIMEYLGWKTYDRLITPFGMTILKLMLILSLAAGMVGLYSSISIKIAAALVLVYQGILGSFGHACAESTVGMYCLAVLAFSPCSDAFSLDGRNRAASCKPGWVYAYPILLMQLLLCWSYFAAGLGKIRTSGMEYFGPSTLPTHAIQNSLHNLHDTQFQFAFSLVPAQDLLWPAVMATVVWEIAFPMAVFLPRTRRFFIVTGILFHAGTWLMMNIIFVNQIAMYCVLLDWPGLLRRMREWLVTAQ